MPLSESAKYALEMSVGIIKKISPPAVEWMRAEGPERFLDGDFLRRVDGHLIRDGEFDAISLSDSIRENREEAEAFLATLLEQANDG